MRLRARTCTAAPQLQQRIGPCTLCTSLETPGIFLTICPWNWTATAARIPSLTISRTVLVLLVRLGPSGLSHMHIRVGAEKHDTQHNHNVLPNAPSSITC